MAYAVEEVARVDEVQVDLDDREQVPLDDPATFRLIRTAHTLGCFQIESPGQRELVGKFGPETFNDIIIDISLFRPGPVKSDMVTPFLEARQRWREPQYLHPKPKFTLEETSGVVVFHEQVLHIVKATAGVEPAGGRRGAPRHGLPGRAGSRSRRGGDRWRCGPGTRRPTSTASGRCSRRSPRSASARRTPPRSPCPPTSRPG
nr:hypothetical protein [Angustibacter aerolatus]